MDMLSSYGQALSQGDGSDFHPGCNWEATSPGYSPCVRTWRSLTSHHRATPAGLTMVAQKSWKYSGMLAGVAGYGRSRKWGCSGSSTLGFKPRHSSHDKKSHMDLGLPLQCSIGSRKARCSSYAELSTVRKDAEGFRGSL